MAEVTVSSTDRAEASTWTGLPKHETNVDHPRAVLMYDARAKQARAQSAQVVREDSAEETLARLHARQRIARKTQECKATELGGAVSRGIRAHQEQEHRDQQSQAS